MSAAAVWTRSLWRRHWRATILVGLFLGPVVIALATALLRFAEETVGGGR